MTPKVTIKDKLWRKILASVKQMGRSEVRVGVFDGDITELAAIHEFGAPNANIPERSFIRRTLNHTPWLPKFTATLAKQILEGKMTEDRALGILGAKGASEVKKTITDGRQLEPLKAATIARKGSDRPLVDTGRLVNSITWRVIQK